MKKIASVLLALSLVACQSTVADTKPASDSLSATAKSVGFSPKRLERISTVMQDYIDKGKLAGTLTLVARDGKIAYLNAQGMMDREAGKAMTEDTIFRIYSMSKPVTSVAAMTL